MEEWKPIPDFDGYEASNLGRIRSLDREVRSGCCGYRLQRGRVRALGLQRNGYLYVRLSMGVGCQVHALVALAWIGPRPEGFDINHRDGVKTNNRPENLEYLTRAENYRHACETGLYCPPSGESHYSSKVTWEQVAAIRETRSRHPRRGSGVIKFLARWFNVSQPTISAICCGQNWNAKRQGSTRVSPFAKSG